MYVNIGWSILVSVAVCVNRGGGKRKVTWWPVQQSTASRTHAELGQQLRSFEGQLYELTQLTLDADEAAHILPAGGRYLGTQTSQRAGPHTPQRRRKVVRAHTDTRCQLLLPIE